MVLVHMKHNRLSLWSRLDDNTAQHDASMCTLLTVIVMMAIGDYVCIGHHIVNSVAAAIAQAQSVLFQCQLPTADIFRKPTKQ